jgi:penicillin-binding protein 1A
MKAYSRILVLSGGLLTSLVLVLGSLFSGGYYYVAPSLPGAEVLRDVRLQIPFSVYSRDGRLMAQFGEQMRTPAPYETIPELLIQAVLAAEDDQFFSHPGMDFTGTARAVLNFLTTGGDRVPGGSTITQQVAREYFLTREVTLVRKFKEWILAFRIEREFSKEEILELYLNTYFFGHQSYGVVAAAQTYFGKALDELTLSDVAIIAGIPQGPSIMNPFTSPQNAAMRRAYVLRRMRELDMISEAQHQAALAEPVAGRRYRPQPELAAPYIAEMVRAEVIRRLGPAAYETGLRVTTTVDSRLQAAARDALRRTVLEYDERHGYRGPLDRVALETLEPEPGQPVEKVWDALLGDYAEIGGYEVGLVVGVAELPGKPHQIPAEEPAAAGVAAPAPVETRARVYFADQGEVSVGFDAVSWAAPYLDDNRVGRAPASVLDVLSAGDVVRFRTGNDGALRLAQLPEVQGALVSLDPQDGAIAALVGGFDFTLSNYNRAVQSQRQPGSAFKPFIYSAALENGFTAATIVNDAPIVERSSDLEEVWRPENYSGRFSGPTRLREALVRSLNLVSIRVVREVGIGHTVRHIRGFGFDDTALPANLTLALGAGGVAPLDLATGYATFANGGFEVDPYLIERIEDVNGNVIYEATPKIACAVCTEESEEDPLVPSLIVDRTELYRDSSKAGRVITAQNAYLINDMMRDVVRRGTGRRAYTALAREDLAGKTGTTNDRRDAWFAGFNGDLVAATWVGFDQERSLGRYEEGGRTALPMWIYYMSEALSGLKTHAMQRPPGIVDVRINPESGLVTSDSRNSVFEKFRIDEVPDREADSSTWQPQTGPSYPRADEDDVRQPLF